MSLLSEISEILAHLEGRRPDIWGRQAGRIAEGIRQSGLHGALDAGFQQTRSGLAGLAAVIGVATEKICAEIALSNTFLSSIADALNNPKGTEASESFRRGLRALKNGWIADAIEELEMSVRADRYVPLVHATLGIAYRTTAPPSAERAVESFRNAMYYARPGNPEIEIGAGILAASTLRDLGRSDEATSMLSELASKYPNCAELALTHSRVSGNLELSRHALWLAPELAAFAIATEVDGMVELAEELALDSDGPVADARRLRDARAALSIYCYRNGTSDPLTDLDTGTPAEQMSTAGTLLLAASSELIVFETMFEQSIWEDERREKAYAEGVELDRRLAAEASARIAKSALVYQRTIQGLRETSAESIRRQRRSFLNFMVATGATVLLTGVTVAIFNFAQAGIVAALIGLATGFGIFLSSILAIVAYGAWFNHRFTHTEASEKATQLKESPPAIEVLPEPGIYVRVLSERDRLARIEAMDEIRRISRLRANRTYAWDWGQSNAFRR